MHQLRQIFFYLKDLDSEMSCSFSLRDYSVLTLLYLGRNKSSDGLGDTSWSTLIWNRLTRVLRTHAFKVDIDHMFNTTSTNTSEADSNENIVQGELQFTILLINLRRNSHKFIHTRFYVGIKRMRCVFQMGIFFLLYFDNHRARYEK